MKRILVTNDDGINSPGILALVRALKSIPNVHIDVVAPDRQQSAVGHALTVSSPLRATKFHRDGDYFGWAINGTPADCVKLGISSLLEHTPDLVVSGINHGSNTAVNILYSGTVSAATEGMLMGVNSIAVSLQSFSLESDCEPSAQYAKKIAQYTLENPLPSDTILNVNIPHLPQHEIKGIRITHQGKSLWNDRYDKRLDPMGTAYYWLHGEYKLQYTDNVYCDDIAIREGYVSVSPIRYELTNTDYLSAINNIENL